jgi:hypothetical protein
MKDERQENHFPFSIFHLRFVIIFMMIFDCEFSGSGSYKIVSNLKWKISNGKRKMVFLPLILHPSSSRPAPRLAGMQPRRL